VSYGDPEVGEIGVTKAAGEPLRPAEQRLLSNLASEAGVALTNARLAIELEDRFDELSVQAAELEASRARIVTAADTERRRLESEIRTEVGDPLAALRSDVISAGQAVDADRIADLIATVNTILDSLREIARGAYPPILAVEGLTRAIESLTSRLDNAPEIDIDGVVNARFASEVEAAVYYSVAQAVRSLDRDGASSSTPVIHVTADEAGITFDTPAELPAGTTEQIGDRVAALGGTVVKDERLRGFIPASTTAPTG
jgi:signal transduction histidine kinase